jgi:cytoskeletal protein CcmA (bactofilin family)
MRRHVVAVVAFALALLALAATASPAFARSRPPGDSDRIISVTGDIDIPRGVTIDGPVATADGDVDVKGTVTDFVIAGEGNVTVSGKVTRGVLVLHGNAKISGRVGGDVVALSGRVIVTSDGSVGGDVVSRRDPQIARGTVEGEVRRFDLRALFTGLIIGALVYLWVAVTLSIAVLGLLFVWLLPRAAETAASAGKRVAASFGWGALVGIVGPMVAVLVLASILGIPLGITMLSALTVLAPIGYVTTALVIGRLFVKGPSNRSRIGAFFAGFGILRLLALIPGVGFIVWFVACLYGLGAASMAAWYGGHRLRPGDDSAEHDALPPPPASPPAAPPAESSTAAVPVTVPAGPSTASVPATAEPTTETSTESVSWTAESSAQSPPQDAEPES